MKPGAICAILAGFWAFGCNSTPNPLPSLPSEPFAYPDSILRSDTSGEKTSTDSALHDLSWRERDAPLKKLAADSSGALFVSPKTLNGDSIWVVTAWNDADVRMVIFGNKPDYAKILVVDYDRCRFSGFEILDADFDGREDFLVKDYSCVGCCPRDFSDIYLWRNGKLRKDPAVTTSNAFFDSKNRTVQEMDYGFPPFTQLSKSVWRSDTLACIEIIHYHLIQDLGAPDGFRLGTPPFLRTNLLTGESDSLKVIPPEYEGVYDIDWFSGY